MKRVVCLFVFMGLFFAACFSTANTLPINPEQVKKIYVKPITNSTNQYGLEANFMLALNDEIMQDGRITFVNTGEESDATLVINIKKYILRPLTYDASMVAEQYKLWVIASVTLIDTQSDETLWEESDMEAIQIYLDKSDDMGELTTTSSESEEKARTIIWEKLSRNIVKTTVKGFISAKNVAEKKDPI